MTGDARALAATLRGLSDEALARVLAKRSNGSTSWHDLFDVAEALLEPHSIRAALTRIPRDEAIALTSGAAGTAPTAAELALVATNGLPFRAVADVIATLPTPVTETAAPATAVDSAEAAEVAFTTVAAIADLLVLSYRHPLQQIGSGALASAERRRLLEAEVVTVPEDVDALVAIATTANLLRPVEREWLVTSTGAEWLTLSTAERWRALHSAMMRELGALATELTPSALRSAFPWDDTWPARADALLHEFTMLGLQTRQGEPTAWSLGDDSLLHTHLPAEVDRVFLQNDLSAIAPGPLEPSAALRLRTVADRESNAQASTYRFSEASLQRGFAAGETQDSLLEFLSTISLTGVPQPLRYLVGSVASRVGDITVQTEPDSPRTLIRTATPALAQTLLIDQGLRALGLVRDENILISRVTRDTVAHALSEARYPVTIIDADGSVLPLRRGRTASAIDPDAPSDEIHDLVTRLRSGKHVNEDAAWLQRELEQAVRHRATVEVTVALPDGERTMLLEATGLGGGRLRGRDRNADVERTLPLSHITAARVVHTDGPTSN